MEGIHLSKETEVEAVDLDEIRGNPAERIVVPHREPSAMAPAPMADSSARSMLAFMVQQGVDIDRIKAMTQLLHEEEDRAAKQTFDLKFAQMQGKFVPVPRAGKADFASKREGGARVTYDFATIEDMVKANGRVIADHGFSYHFSEEAIEGKPIVRFFLHINGWGHERTTYVDLPAGAGKTDLMTAAQGSRSLQSYGQRYAMFAGFGFVTEGDDDDAAGLTFEFGVEFSNEIALIREMTRENWKEQWAIAIKDKPVDIVEKLAVIRKQVTEQWKKEDREAHRG